jgi:phage host-nuclease inhibitor protein Gam
MKANAKAKQEQALTKRDRLIMEIDELFDKIKTEKKALEKLETSYQKQLEKLQAKYYPEIEARKQALRTYEEELEKLATRYAPELFGDGDLCETRLGRLIKQIKVAVKKARGVLEKLEKLGWTEAIIIEKKVNWAVLEQWPDEKLIACGTERVRKVRIVYELKTKKTKEGSDEAKAN